MMGTVQTADVVMLPDGRMDPKNAATYCGLSVKTLDEAVQRYGAEVRETGTHLLFPGRPGRLASAWPCREHGAGAAIGDGVIRPCAPTASATGRTWLGLKRLQVAALLALHRWLPMLSHLLG